MSKHKIPVRFTGQHFTVDTVLIADSLKLAELSENDLVLDIGAGKGFLTVQLEKNNVRIIAIEKDPALTRFLKNRFYAHQQITILGMDFRNYALPQEPFKVVSNIPYAITADILRALLFTGRTYFRGGTLVMQLEAARKLCAPRIFNPYVICYHAFFDISLVREIGPGSFMPPPNVRSALVRIRKKENGMIAMDQAEKYVRFLQYMLQKPDLPVRTALKNLFRKSQVRVLMNRYGIDPDIAVNAITAAQWAACFNAMLQCVPERYHPG